MRNMLWGIFAVTLLKELIYDMHLNSMGLVLFHMFAKA